MSSLTGNFAGLSALAGTLRRLATVPARASKLAAEKLNAEVQRQYDQGVDAYGMPWAPLSPATLARGRFPPPLTHTRAMRDGTRFEPMAGDGLSLTFSVPYAVFHHTGTRTMPARPVAPTGGAFPRAWDLAIKAACAAATGVVMGGK